MISTPPAWPTISPGLAGVLSSLPTTVDVLSLISVTFANVGPTSVTRPASAPPWTIDDVAQLDAVVGALVEGHDRAASRASRAR